jgi:hypothetical protein
MSAAGVFFGFLAVAFLYLFVGTLARFALQFVGILATALGLITHGGLLSIKYVSNYAYTLLSKADPVNAPPQGTQEAPV